MKKRLLAIVLSLTVALTMLIGGRASVFADTAEGELPWATQVKKVSSSWGDYGDATSPVLAGNYLYFMATNSILYKVNKDTGEIAGTTKFDTTLLYNKIAPTVADGKVFVLLNDGKVGIANASTMEKIAEVQYGSKGDQSISPAVYNNGSIYVGSFSGKKTGTFAKIDVNSRYVTKYVTDDDFYWAGACVDGDYIVFGSESGAIYASPKAGGATLSKALGAGKIRSSVVKNGDYYYFTSNDGKLNRIKIEVTSPDFTEVESVELSGPSTCTPVFLGNYAYVGGLTFVDKILLDKSMTKEKVAAPPSEIKNLTIAEGKVYGSCNNTPGQLYSVNEAKVYFTPSGDMSQYCASSIAASEGILYYTNDSNYIMAVKPSTATTKYDVEVSSNEGGSVSPTMQKVASGKAVTVAIKPDEGYKVSDIKVNDLSVKLEDTKYTSYSAENITEDTKIKISFAKVESTAAKIEVSLQKNDGFYVAHETMYVSSTLAEEYGYSDQVTGDKVSALDALVAAHVYKYGEDKAAVQSALLFPGYITRMMSIDSSAVGYTVNETPAPVGADQQTVVDGDRVVFYFYKDTTTWSDILTIFTTGEGKKIKELTAKPGEIIELTLVGSKYDSNWVLTFGNPVEGASISTVNKEDGTVNSLKDSDGNAVITDKDGKFKVAFNREGTYYLTAISGEGQRNIVMPWCKVTCSNETVKGNEAIKEIKTGDNSNILILVIIAAIALAAASAVIIISRKRK